MSRHGFALTNLDTGLLLGKSGWTVDRSQATLFEEPHDVANAAIENQVKNAAASILIHGQIMGHIWVTEPKPN